MRDKCETEAAYEIKSNSKMTVRERLEIRRTRAQENIKYNQEQLNEIEAGLKLLNKNKELETIVNLLSL